MLVGLARCYLAAQMSLFVVEILELEVEAIDFLPRFGGSLFGVSDSEDGFAVEAAKLGEVGVEDLLLLGEFEECGIGVFRGGLVAIIDQVEDGEALLARLGGGVEDGEEEGVCD